MEEFLKHLAEHTALAVEATAVVLVAYGAAEALFICLRHLVVGRTATGWRRDVFGRFGIWLLVGLQFALAADIVRSIISPTWTEIGQLAAIAAIRTFLNYFLERDLKELAEPVAQ
jgi:uncharacterized membrane protein